MMAAPASGPAAAGSPARRGGGRTHGRIRRGGPCTRRHMRRDSPRHSLERSERSRRLEFFVEAQHSHNHARAHAHTVLIMHTRTHVCTFAHAHARTNAVHRVALPAVPPPSCLPLLLTPPCGVSLAAVLAVCAPRILTPAVCNPLACAPPPPSRTRPRTPAGQGENTQGGRRARRRAGGTRRGRGSARGPGRAQEVARGAATGACAV